MRLKPMLAAAVMSLASLHTHAATIVAWDLSGQPGDQVATSPGNATSGVTGTDLTRGTGLWAATGADSFNSTGWGSTDASDYFSFGFSIDGGYAVELDSLLTGTRASNTGPGTIGLYSSLDGFADPIGMINQPGSTAVNSIIDLTGLGVITGSIEFRLMEIGNTQADGSGNTSDSGTFRMTDYLGGPSPLHTQLTGMVLPEPVPLPASLWLFGSALAALLGCRRRGAALSPPA